MNILRVECSVELRKYDPSSAIQIPTPAVPSEVVRNPKTLKCKECPSHK